MRLTLALLALPALACAAPAAQAPTPRSVSIEATATLHLPPDTAAVHLTFASLADELPTAHRHVERDRAAFLSRVEPFEARVETGLVQYSPYRVHRSAPEQHRATQSVIVHTRDFDSIPDLISLATEGLSGVTVRYYVADMVQHRERLREMAIEAANDKATDLARGFDSELGRIMSIQEGGASASAMGVGNFDNAVVRVGPSETESPPPGAIPLRVTLHLNFELVG